MKLQALSLNFEEAYQRRSLQDWRSLSDEKLRLIAETNNIDADAVDYLAATLYAYFHDNNAEDRVADTDPNISSTFSPTSVVWSAEAPTIPRLRRLKDSGKKHASSSAPLPSSNPPSSFMSAPAASPTVLWRPSDFEEKLVPFTSQQKQKRQKDGTKQPEYSSISLVSSSAPLYTGL